MVENNQKKILFVCDWNASRSPMAEVILNHLFADQFTASSAGVEASDYTDPFIIGLCQKKYGINLINKAPIGLQECGDLLNFDLCIALSQNAYGALKKLKTDNQILADLEYWETPTPPDKNQPRNMIAEGYEQLHDEIMAHIENRFASYL